MANKLVGYEYPFKKYKKAWKNVLFNQFHDILAGCSLESAYKDASYLYGESMSVAEQEINFALQAISRKIDTGAPSSEMYKENKWYWENMHVGTPIVLFNHHPYEVTERVTLQFLADKITDENGNEIVMQKAMPEYVDAGNIYLSSFIATVPAMGYKVYKAYTVDGFDGSLNEKQIEISEEGYLNNGVISVEFNKVNGEISKITNVKTGEVLLDGECKALFLDETECDTWAHDKRDLGEVVGEFSNAEFSIVEQGAVFATLRVVTKFNDSVLIRDYTLDKGSDTLIVNGEILTYEKHKTFKLSFPANNTIKASIPFGTVERPINDGEYPFQKWFAVNKIAVLNDCRYGYDGTDDSVRMTVFRTAVYADHYGKRRPVMRYMEQGSTRFKYAICPYTNSLDAYNRANAFLTPIRIVSESFHNGNLPTQFSAVKGDVNVVFSAVKQGENGKGAVVRYYEVNGEKINKNVEFYGKKISVNVNPFEIKTIDENGKEYDFTEME